MKSHCQSSVCLNEERLHWTMRWNEASTNVHVSCFREKATFIETSLELINSSISAYFYFSKKWLNLQVFCHVLRRINMATPFLDCFLFHGPQPHSTLVSLSWLAGPRTDKVGLIFLKWTSRSPSERPRGLRTVDLRHSQKPRYRQLCSAGGIFAMYEPLSQSREKM